MLPHTTPESVGISSDAVNEFARRLAELEHPHSFQLIRHGKIAAEGYFKPYRPDTAHMLFSLSKSFTSIAIGFAAAEGRLSLDEPIAEFFPEALPEEVDPRYRKISIRHLLTMSDGHDRCALEYMLPASDGDWVKAYFRSPLVYEPGSRFVYNSGGSYMLSAALQQRIGVDLLTYLRPRLLDALDIGDRKWERCPRGVCTGGWGFELTTAEIARFGQLLLDGGKWNGVQIIPPDYLREATAFQIDNSMNDQPDWKQGYGFQFWRCRHNAFRGDGAFGQYAVVMPEQDAVFAATSGLRNMQNILDILWDVLLPAMAPAPLPPAAAAHAALSARLEQLALPLPADTGLRRTLHAEWLLEENSIGAHRLLIDSDETLCRFTLSGDRPPLTIEADFEKWRDTPDSTFAAAAVWKSADELHIQTANYATPFLYTFIFRFDGAEIQLERRTNLYFMTTEWPILRSH